METPSLIWTLLPAFRLAQFSSVSLFFCSPILLSLRSIMATSVAVSVPQNNITLADTSMAQVHYIQDPKKSAEHEETIVLEYNDMTAQEKLQDKKLLRKIDLLILPLATLNYFFSSMDRNDIGNAKLAGFQTDNHLTNLGYSTVVAVFYAGYVSPLVTTRFLLYKGFSASPVTQVPRTCFR